MVVQILSTYMSVGTLDEEDGKVKLPGGCLLICRGVGVDYSDCEKVCDSIILEE